MKQYQIINNWDDEEKYEYDIYVDDTDEGTVYRMYYSNNETWSEAVRGTLINKVVDDGNEFSFQFSLGKKLDYCEMAERMILLSFINFLDKMVGYKVLEVKEIAKL